MGQPAAELQLTAGRFCILPCFSKARVKARARGWRLSRGTRVLMSQGGALLVSLRPRRHPALSLASSKEAAFLLARAALTLGPFPQGNEPGSRADSVLGMDEASFIVCSNSHKLGRWGWDSHPTF